MTSTADYPHRFHVRAGLGALLLAVASASLADAPIVQPGAPGEAPQALTAEQATDIANTSYSPADATFMRDMIPHHAQALEMAALVPGRTNNAAVVDIAARIDASQNDEIAFMRGWLSERGEATPDMSGHDHHAMARGMDGHDHTMATDMPMTMSHTMAGMATPEQMAELAAAESTDFDRLFLTLMIAHHEGAITMVEELLELPGSAYDPVLFEFTTDVTNDQTSEIERMNGMLVELSDDPRAGLAAGLYDAGTAIHNLELIASLKKPAGFYDPANPGNLPASRLEAFQKDDEADDVSDADRGTDDAENTDEEESAGDKKSRSPLLSFANTDMAFSGDVLVAGSYHGFNVYKLKADAAPDLMSSIVCPGGQGDVSIVGDLLIMSVEETRGRVDCGLQGINEDISDARFRGIRIFNISDVTRPMQVGAVQTCRGSHTHSVVSGPGRDGKIIVYNSGTSRVRDGEELPGCVGEVPGDERTALFRIDVIEIPVADPSKSRIIDSPTVFADSEDGNLAGLWRGGDHGDDTQETNRTDQCHDITVFPAAKIAAGALLG